MEDIKLVATSLTAPKNWLLPGTIYMDKRRDGDKNLKGKRLLCLSADTYISSTVAPRSRAEWTEAEFLDIAGETTITVDLQSMTFRSYFLKWDGK